MKLRDIIKSSDELKIHMKAAKRKNGIKKQKHMDVKGDGTGDEVQRGINYNEGPL